MFQSVNPHNGEVIAEYTGMDLHEVMSVINDVDDAFHQFKKTDFEFRKNLLKRVSDILRMQKSEYARLMALEMGKPILQGMAEAEKCAWVCDYYAENAESFLKDEIIATDAQKSYVTYQPLGVILAIMPWNFPFWQVFRFAAPTLMAGNGVLLKHSPNVTGCALEIEKIFNEAGFPQNIFRTIVTDISNVEQIIRNKKIAAVTLTGSTRAGKSVATIAGSELKKCVLELGGSDPYIIMEDADIAKAVQSSLIGRMLNTGQSCIAAKRIIIFENVYENFKELFVSEVAKLKVGNPLDETNYIGAIARKDLQETLHSKVQTTVDLGATLLTGGFIPEVPGFYYPPTILENIPENSPAFSEEIFGPVALLFKVKSIDEALLLANSSDYGLGSAVFTNDISQGESIAKTMLDAGSSFVNSFVKSDPRLPFGGIKQSGHGRELSAAGIKEFVNVKTVFVA
ncbi:NAD-dependent succinate-semialdehyde dehydrogenase [Ignavibacteriales bacterium]